MDKYFKYFELSVTASLQDVKTAYKRKAMLLHPDRNNSSNAKEQFIELNEYYEVLVNYITGKVFDDSSQRFTDKARKKASSYESIYQASAKRAKKYAEMNFEAFINSKRYRDNFQFDEAFDRFRLIFVGCFSIGIPFVVEQFKPGSFPFTFLIVNFMAAPMIINEVREVRKNKTKREVFRKDLEIYLRKKNK